MRFSKILRRLFARAARRPQARPALEVLETRVVPYSASGNAWPNPQLVTISFVPDGTVLALGNGGNITSNMFATFNAIPGITSPSQWQNIILKAAQSWAAQTNVNVSLASDDGSQAGSGDYQQGASNFGDIRVGAYNFGLGDTWLSSTFYPPPANNYSVAGDVSFNTAYGFNIGSTYDLFTVAEHEIGHALGLGLSGSIGAVMYGTYNGAVSGLGSDDITGIRSIYSGGNPRAKDAYDASSSNNSFATASNISATIDPGSLTAVINTLDITSTVNSQDTVTTADVDYYKFTAPSNSASRMTISVQSAGLSLLSPLVTVYASNQTTVLGTANGRYLYGTTLTLSNIAVTPGSTYYIKVQGADNTVMSTGAYALTLNLGTGANPIVPLPNTQVLNGDPLHSGGGQPMFSDPASPSSARTSTAFATAASVIENAPNRNASTPVLSIRTTTSPAPLSAAPTTPATSVLCSGSISAARSESANDPAEAISEQPTAPPSDDAGTPPASVIAPSDAAAGTVSHDTGLAAAAEATGTPSASAPAGAEATTDTWTPDAALAAVSIIFAGPWLRSHGAHDRQEERKHHLTMPDRSKKE